MDKNLKVSQQAILAAKEAGYNEGFQAGAASRDGEIADLKKQIEGLYSYEDGYRTARQEGRREVVEWVEANAWCIHLSQNERWQTQLAAWGIKE